MSGNALQGKVEIEVARYTGLTPRVHIRHHYPDLSGRLFRSMPPGRLIDSLPRFYALCSTAQGICAQTALESVAGHSPGLMQAAARELLLAVENTQEHLWRFFVEWPAFIDATPQRQDVVTLKSWLPTLHRALYRNGDHLAAAQPVIHVDSALLQVWFRSYCDLLERQVFGTSACNWLARDTGRLIDWWHDSDTLLAQLLCHLDRQGLARRCDVAPTPLPQFEYHQLAEAFPDRGDVLPIWKDRPMETTSLARRIQHPVVQQCIEFFGYGLLTRLLSRAVEVAEACLRCGELVNTLCWQKTEASEPIGQSLGGIGYAQVETARGRLVHRLELEHGVVQDYAILPPTCWNFHPEGIIKQSLESLPADDFDGMRQVSEMLVKLVDPCVSHRIHFSDRGRELGREYA